MSSPVHLPEDLDAALMYAPPWARQPGNAKPPTADGSCLQNPPTISGGENHPPSFVGDRAMLALRRRLSLDPEAAPEPPLAAYSGYRIERIALRLSAVAAVVALAVWAVNSLMSVAPVEDEPAQATVHATVAAETFVKPVKLLHVSPVEASGAGPIEAPPAHSAMLASTDDGRAAPPPSSDSDVRRDPARSSDVELRPDPAPPARPAIDPGEIATLLARGKEQLTNGDISSARLLLRPAAEAGSVEAALTLASTYDPLVIGRLGAVGVQPDANKARQWYQKAAALGSNLAAEQLAELARRGE